MAAVFNTYMRQTIGIGAQARVDVVKDNGLDSFAAFRNFEDDDVKTLATAVRKDNNVPINAIIEKKMKLACYGARTYAMISRPVDSDSLSSSRLRELEIHKKVVKDHKDPVSDITKVSKSYSIDKALDTLPNFLRSKFGVRGVALSYVIREVETPPALNALSPDKPYSRESGSLMEELIIHTPHEGAAWDEDNATVFAILQEMVRDVPMASSLKRHQRTRNGRAAYLSLVQHNLGSAQWDKIILKAEEVQNVRVWNGRNGRYSIRRHVDMHRDAFNDMVRASDSVAYEVPNERTRVSRLLRSVQASHMASIAAAKTTIEATPAMRDDFELAADFLILNAPASQASGRSQRISQVTFEDDDEDLHDLKAVKVDDRFYTPQEYRELSNQQKHKLKLLRSDRGADSKKSGKGKGKGKGKRKGGTSGRPDKKFKKMQSENKKLKQRISALETKTSPSSDDDAEQDSDDNESDTSVQFNQRTGKSKKSKK